MLNVEVDTKAVDELLDSMKDRIKEFGHKDMPEGMTEWQTGEMNRKYPETTVEETPVGTSAFTQIFPRSRTYEQMKRSRVLRPATRKPSRLVAAPDRPILRPELLDAFVKQMSELLENIKWR